MNRVSYIPFSEISRIQNELSDPFLRAGVLSNLFRINTLYMIMKAGSGHIGTSFSSLDIMAWLWTREMENPNEPEKNPSDIFFSSKGHDAPALYSLMIGLGKLDFEYIHTLRRLGGLPGHPDVGTPSIPTNTGSLGTGISKARGMALANRLNKKQGRVYVLTGDGELQEGQIWESLQPTANGKFGEITVIVDNNKLQSDTLVSKVSDLGDVEAKFKSFGWEVARCSGHDFHALADVFAAFKNIPDRPKILIADTIKGKGVSFMEQPPADDLYAFHSGAPLFSVYEKALTELADAVNAVLTDAGLGPIVFEQAELEEKKELVNPEKLVAAYGDELVKIAAEREDVVAMDADLVKDTGLVAFKNKFPERYVECGIAEQDMVSFAGGLALSGKLPVVHSFECFLSTRPNEQIYNNATEHTKIIYTGSLAGLLPSAPGHSHQSVRGISALGSIPGLVMVEPANEAETRMAIRWAVEKNKSSSYIRLVSVPLELPYALGAGYALHEGRGVVLVAGTDVAIIAYGPTMLTQAAHAAQKLSVQGVRAAVINVPWLNVVDEAWLAEEAKKYKTIITIDDHYAAFGQGQMIAAALARSGYGGRVISLGLGDIPACGGAGEVLAHHGLDAESIAAKVRDAIK